MRDGIAYCGLDCSVCPALLATRRGDMDSLAETAARWSGQTGREIRPEAILCDGCESRTGRINEFCSVCAIRECASARGLMTCAACGDYPCARLSEFSAFEREGRERLDALRRAN